MFSTEELDRIVFATDLPPKIVPGNHAPCAEGFRDVALTKLAKVSVLAGTLGILLRERPDDDGAFDTVAASFVTAVREAGENVAAFRDTRDVVGEA